MGLAPLVSRCETCLTRKKRKELRGFQSVMRSCNSKRKISADSLWDKVARGLGGPAETHKEYAAYGIGYFSSIWNRVSGHTRI